MARWFSGSGARRSAQQAGQNTSTRGSQILKPGKTMGVLGTGFMLFDGITTYAERRHEHPDENKLVSASYAAGTAALWEMFPGVMFGLMAAGVAKQAGAAYQNLYRDQKSRYMQNTSRDIGGGFVDTEMAYTMRQRGLQAISSSRLNARSALGNEARSLHH